jgi:hypothetical protein
MAHYAMPPLAGVHSQVERVQGNCLGSTSREMRHYAAEVIVSLHLEHESSPRGERMTQFPLVHRCFYEKVGLCLSSWGRRSNWASTRPTERESIG